MTFKPYTQQIAFVLPLYFSKAEIILSRSKVSRENLSYKILPGKEPRHVVSTENLDKGFWLAQLIWSDGRSQFCQEKLIEIQ